MKTWALITLALLLVLITPFDSIAEDFDGSRPLIFSLISVDECTLAEGCQQVQPEDVGLPRFMRIDFDSSQIFELPDMPDVPPSLIERMEVVDGKMMLQGAEDGRQDLRDGFGWTFAISLETGKTVLSGSGDGFGLIIFGACLPLPSSPQTKEEGQ